MAGHPTYSGNGIASVYHIFLYDYESFKSAIRDLDRIGAMGFNTVLISPVNTAGKTFATTCVDRETGITSRHQVVGSVYGAVRHNEMDERFLFGKRADKRQSIGNVAEETQKIMRRF